jgi:putative membrane protein
VSDQPKVIWDAEFNDSVTTYWLINGMILCLVTIIGIPLLPIWFFAGKWVTRKYLDTHKATLTERSLKFSKGIFTKIEKTVPLDRITDLGLVQGPLMRYFDIEALAIETAGQSTAGAMIQLAGIKNGRKFRDAVLAQRDRVSGGEITAGNKTVPTEPNLESNAQTDQLLTEIRDILTRIEQQSSRDSISS